MVIYPTYAAEQPLAPAEAPTKFRMPPPTSSGRQAVSRWPNYVLPLIILVPTSICLQLKIIVGNNSGLPTLDATYSQKDGFLHSEKDTISTRKSIVHDGNVPLHFQPSCVGLNETEEMEDIIAKTGQLFIVMPPKSAGTSLKEFVYNCMIEYETGDVAKLPTPEELEEKLVAAIQGKALQVPGQTPKVDNPLAGPNRLETLLLQEGQPPPVVASHLVAEERLMELIRDAAGRHNTILYFHREETERLVSAVGFVFYRACVGGLVRSSEESIAALIEVSNETHCILREGPIIQDIIKPRVWEIWVGTKDLWRCPTFDALEDHGTNVLFVSYKEATRVQQLVSKQHCPKTLDKIEALQGNQKTTRKQEILVRTQGSSSLQPGTLVKSKEWVESKRNLLEVSLGLRKGATCQKRIGDWEERMSECPDHSMKVSGSFKFDPLF